MYSHKQLPKGQDRRAGDYSSIPGSTLLFLGLSQPHVQSSTLAVHPAVDGCGLQNSGIHFLHGSYTTNIGEGRHNSSIELLILWFASHIFPCYLPLKWSFKAPPWNTTRPSMFHFSSFFFAAILVLYHAIPLKCIFTSLQLYIYIHIILMSLDQRKPKKILCDLQLLLQKNHPSRPACRPWRVWTSWERV